MTTTTALTTQAEQALDQSYAKFKSEQLTLDKSQLFENADQIFAMKEIEAATRQYLFDDEIAQQVIKLDAQVLPTMYQKRAGRRIFETEFYGQ
ncbi:hypothetical protein [Lactiplantibacillus pentosus]|uniref:hypothetical protein n=1 Tax=Lactiplantibacillus pentosus TaxID=1589 RepID=UPI001CDCB2AF|nr:hypothetical protein [Lactiplantibacillus pentosus]